MPKKKTATRSARPAGAQSSSQKRKPAAAPPIRATFTTAAQRQQDALEAAAREEAGRQEARAMITRIHRFGGSAVEFIGPNEAPLPYGERLILSIELQKRQNKARNEAGLAGVKAGAALVHESLGADAERGRKVIDGSRKGYKEAHGSPVAIAQRDQLRGSYQQEVQRLYKEEPRRTYRKIAELAGKTFRVSERTIRKYTSNPRQHRPILQ